MTRFARWTRSKKKSGRQTFCLLTTRRYADLFLTAFVSLCGTDPFLIQPNGDWYAFPLPPTPPPSKTAFERDPDNAWINDTFATAEAAREQQLGSIKKVCTTISTTANVVLELTPQNTLWVAATGKTLGGQEVGAGGRLLAAGAMLPGGFIVEKVVGRTVTACCGKVTICLFIQKHHLIPKTRFANNKLIKAAGIDIEKDANNVMYLLNHGGDHTEEYYRTVNQLLEKGYNDFQAGNKTAKEAYEGVCKTLREGITDSSIKPYDIKDVYPAPIPSIP